MAYRVVLHSQAQKFFAKQDKKTTARLQDAIEEIRVRPKSGRHRRKLRGPLANKYRYRVGDLRIIYEVHEDQQVVRVVAIDRRGKIY